MRIRVRHATIYSYAAPSRYSVQTLRLMPPEFDGQRVLSWRIEAPGIETAARFRDGFGNTAHLITCSEPHDRTEIIAEGTVETTDTAGVVSGLAEPAPRRVFLRATPLTAANCSIRALAAKIESAPGLDRLHGLSRCIREAMAFETGVTDAETVAEQALVRGKGVCQDYAHVFIAASRVLGIPARYVNGYLATAEDGIAEAHHAWAEAWVDGLGWVGFDSANGTCPTDRYIRLACGLDARSAAPIRGTRHGAADERLDIAVDVQQESAQQ